MNVKDIWLTDLLIDLFNCLICLYVSDKHIQLNKQDVIKWKLWRFFYWQMSCEIVQLTELFIQSKLIEFLSGPLSSMIDT